MAEPTMTARGYLRGHPMHFDGVWRYDDTGEPTEGNPRPCGHCRLPDREDGHDACLGNIPGVRNACCGHGQDSEAYVDFDNGGPHLSGKRAIDAMRVAIYRGFGEADHE